jgi:hypothetical protein
MLGGLKYALGYSTTPGPIFVIGTGRSGTHWLGYSLGDHPEVRATIEVRPIFDWSTQMALNPSLEPQLFSGMVRAYRWQLFHSPPRLYLDKTHPNIWIAEKLKDAFPHALFLGIERDPYGTVASMMRNPGVADWHKRWKEFPIPNRFLGIDEETAKVYDDIPLAAQCAMRWVAHRRRMNELRSTLGDALKVISYEVFAYNTEETLEHLQHFLGLQKPIPVPDVKIASLTAWKTHLSEEEVQQIQDVVGFPPDVLGDPSDVLVHSIK